MPAAKPHYLVSLEPRIPDFDSERLFAINEHHYAQRAQAEIKRRHGIMKLLSPVAGEKTEADWDKYMDELERYLADVEHHQAEIESGIVPVKFFIENAGGTDDEAISIKVLVRNGLIHPNKQPPRRPLRIDGPQHVPDWQPTPAPASAPISGFSRTNISITNDSVSARFSELAAHDSADLIHQILYIEGNEKTSFEFEIQSKHVTKPVHGEISF